MTEQEHNDKIKHLDYIQAVITRMATASFSIKTAAITITGAVIALMPKLDTCHWNYRTLLLLVPIVSFWYLDAYYLKMERCFRHLYDAVRTSQAPTDFSMSLEPYLSRESMWKVMAQPPLSILYIATTIVLIVFLML
ncbi:hypothetical protein [Komagataeibacter sp. FNDCF1]|uniref:hypothetical protein n=1 Tax=Komagataeibacter sp. FNDCF1 TaxID=2878681 RepID=UPI001E3C199F|nr:hypothetical protein [Komagataeibacter sp. FNDCF1]MCE2564618.1 hypothetical protein [Komagataeibacter sp. FNDCF1]